MSYRKRHLKSKIRKIKPRVSIFKRLWFWLAILIVIIISSGCYFFIFCSTFQIKNIIILGNEKVANQDLINVVSDDIKIELISFLDIKITSESIFLINKEKIRKNILDKFPAIEKAILDRKFPQTLVLNVIERSPLGAYCPSEGLEGCFLIDHNGIIFEPISRDILRPFQEECCKISIVRQTFKDSQVLIGQKVLPLDTTGIIYKIQKFLQDGFQINLQEALITSPVRLNANTSENWRIYFDLGPDSDFDFQLTKLSLLLTNEISLSERKKLRYIDLRPKDRAIVCDNQTCGQ